MYEYLFSVEGRIFLFAFLAVALLIVGLFNVGAIKSRRARKVLDQLESAEGRTQVAQGDDSLSKRVLLPMMSAIASRLGISSDVSVTEHIWKRLWKAGLYWMTPGQYIAVRLTIVGGLALFFVFYLVARLLAEAQPVWIGGIVVIGSYWMPELWLNARISSREQRVSAAIPDAVDNLSVALEAGLAFDSALSKVAKNVGGPLGEEFGRVLGELQIGSTRSDALAALAERSGSRELQRLTTTLVQADKYGISSASALKTLADEFRKRRFSEVEERAAKLPVKVVVPLILCILPALLMVIVGPAVVGIVELMS